MFSGIVRAIGRVERAEPFERGRTLRIRSDLSSLASGDSIAIDGVCQTVTRAETGAFEVQAIRTTLSRTTLGEFEPGRLVNLERALRLADTVDGHLVQGHIDGVGLVQSVKQAGESVLIRIELTPEVFELTVPLGSLAIDGVSLTVNALDRGVAEVAIIPYTWSHTSLSRLTAGARVNLEADLIGKYVQRLLSRGTRISATPADSPERKT